MVLLPWIISCEDSEELFLASKINVFSNNKNMAYVEIRSEYKRVVRWRPILEELGLIFSI